MDHETTVPLNFLLKAPSRDCVVRLCNEAFLGRNDVKIQGDVINSTAETFGINGADSEKLLNSLRKLVKLALFQASNEAGDILSLFPDAFHKNLRDLLTKILMERLPEWKAHALNNLVSLPRLVDFDWRVDVKTAANNLSRMSVPTCLVQLKIKEDQVESSSDDHSVVTVELSKETLDTMLDGLGKIRDQLNSVASKS